MKLIFLFLILLPLQALAESVFKLSQVEVQCYVSEFCRDRKLRYNNLVGDYRSLLHLKETLRILASDGGYQSLSYEIDKTGDSHKLFIKMILKPTIREISVGTSDRNLQMDPAQLLSVREGDFFEIQKLKTDISVLKTRLDSMGYPHNTHQLNVVQKKDKVDISLTLTLGKPRLFKKIKTNSTSSYVNEFLHKKFINFYNKPFEFTKFKLFLD